MDIWISIALAMPCKAVHDIKEARIETEKILISHSFDFYEDFIVSWKSHFNQFPKLPQHGVVDRCFCNALSI